MSVKKKNFRPLPRYENPRSVEELLVDLDKKSRPLDEFLEEVKALDGTGLQWIQENLPAEFHKPEAYPDLVLYEKHNAKKVIGLAPKVYCDPSCLMTDKEFKILAQSPKSLELALLLAKQKGSGLLVRPDTNRDGKRTHTAKVAANIIRNGVLGGKSIELFTLSDYPEVFFIADGMQRLTSLWRLGCSTNLHAVIRYDMTMDAAGDLFRLSGLVAPFSLNDRIVTDRNAKGWKAAENHDMNSLYRDRKRDLLERESPPAGIKKVDWYIQAPPTQMRNVAWGYAVAYDLPYKGRKAKPFKNLLAESNPEPIGRLTGRDIERVNRDEQEGSRAYLEGNGFLWAINVALAIGVWDNQVVNPKTGKVVLKQDYLSKREWGSLDDLASHIGEIFNPYDISAKTKSIRKDAMRRLTHPHQNDIWPPELPEYLNNFRHKGIFACLFHLYRLNPKMTFSNFLRIVVHMVHYASKVEWMVAANAKTLKAFMGALFPKKFRSPLELFVPEGYENSKSRTKTKTNGNSE